VAAGLGLVGEPDRWRDQVVRLEETSVEPQRHEAQGSEAGPLGVRAPQGELPGPSQVWPHPLEFSNPPLVVSRPDANGQLECLPGQALDVRRVDLLAGCFVKQFRRIGPHGLVQSEPRLTRGVRYRSGQVVLHQPGDVVEYIATGRVSHRLGIRESPRSHEHRQPGQQRTLLGGQQVQAPGQGVTQGPLPAWQIGCSRAQVERGADPVKQGTRGEQGAAACGQLESQRDSVQPPAQLHDGISIPRILEGEGRPHGPGPVDEEPDRGGLLHGGSVVAQGEVERS
jgi:hypothetical protein